MARNRSSRFSLNDGFDREVENLHGDIGENSRRNSTNANSVTSTTDTSSENEDKSSIYTNEVQNTRSASSDMGTISTKAGQPAGNTTAGGSPQRDAAASFNPAAEAEFIAKSCLYDESKTKRITIQFNRDIYDYVKRESRVRGLSINNFVRMIILSYMSVPGNKHYVDFD